MRIFLVLLGLVLVITALGFWGPQDRQPTVFYHPVVLPLETIEGDILFFEDGTCLVVDEDKRINTMQYQSGVVTVNATIHKSLWQILTK